MAKDRKLSLPETNGKRKQGDEEEEEDFDASSKRDHGRKSKKAEIEESDHSSDFEGDKNLSRSKKKKKKISNSKRRSSRRRYSDEDSSSSYSSDSDESASDSKSDGSDYSSEDSESEDERRRRKRKERERRRRKEREYEKERRRRRREKEKKRRKRDKEGKDKKKKKESMKGAVTNSWGKYGIIKETDMWNKRPEFTAWLLEIKQVNLETLPKWEEKQMFKEFMEDHNTATFPSKKYYGLDAYHKREMEKEMKKGFKRIVESERTVFNDEEQRRHELMLAREKQKEEQVETLKLSMQTGMAQAMKEQAQLREEMAYQYKLGNFEAAAAIQRRLDPDVAM